MSREQALERYHALPLPSTSDEHWRFTNLRGFDPEAFKHGGVHLHEPSGSVDGE